MVKISFVNGPYARHGNGDPIGNLDVFAGFPSLFACPHAKSDDPAEYRHDHQELQESDCREPEGECGDQFDIAAAHRVERKKDRKQSQEANGDANLDGDIRP